MTTSLPMYFYCYIFNKYKVLNKIAFYINEEYIYDHYKNIISVLDNNYFDIVLANKFKDEKYHVFLNDLESNNQTAKFLDEVFGVYKYKCLLTHTYLGGDCIEPLSFLSRLKSIVYRAINKMSSLLNIKKTFKIKDQYFQNILGVINIRFMYGADSGGTKFGSWNNLFELFFCHGPRDAEIVRRMFEKPIFEMGYPRYDGYFEKKNNYPLNSNIKNKLHCDNNKKTILWICTVSRYFSTVLTYGNTMRGLKDEYNVIVRPHPLEIDEQYDRYNHDVYKLVHGDDFILSDDPFQDMTELYRISDFVICDYGGSIFSALYMQQKILLLNNFLVDKDIGIKSSTSIEVRDYMMSVNEDEQHKIRIYLEDTDCWKTSEDNIEKVRLIYFGNNYGGSAKKAADKLLTFLN